MKFILFVEGELEQRALPLFLKNWLDTRISQPVGIKSVLFDGCAELVKSAPKKAIMYLNGPDKSDIIAVIALLDLYCPAIHYPADKPTVSERYVWAKEYFEGQINHSRFRQFFAVHETEAWLLSNPSLFPSEIQRVLLGKSQHPEKINFDNPPAKLLSRLYEEKLRRTYKKTTNGATLFSKLDPDLAYGKCPHLKQMLDEMLKLAKAEGL